MSCIMVDIESDGPIPVDYSMNLGSFYKGLVRDTFKNFKYLRKTRHIHNPVDDAMGNAEAMLEINREFGLKMKIE